MPTNLGVLDLALRLDGRGGSQPSQVHAGLREAILEGRLAAGTRLPSSRALADQLGLRRNAVVVAYEHLLSDGLAEARVGAGTYVTAHLPRAAAPAVPVIVKLKGFSLASLLAMETFTLKLPAEFGVRPIANQVPEPTGACVAGLTVR